MSQSAGKLRLKEFIGYAEVQDIKGARLSICRRKRGTQKKDLRPRDEKNMTVPVLDMLWFHTVLLFSNQKVASLFLL